MLGDIEIDNNVESNNTSEYKTHIKLMNRYMYDSNIDGNIGTKFIISDKLLGQGSYGNVFLGNDEKGRKIAIKCCEINKHGIPNILEASIMASISHPYLNRSLRILAHDKLYIIQDVAISDMAQHTRKTENGKMKYKPSMIELKQWCFCIADAVSALHDENIIHADIKASNVLLYDDGSVKLTDFTLARKKWYPKEKFTHNACTCTHRPLECLLGNQWDESLDIWSLACTFYEIAFGELLFPYQGALEPENISKDKKFRKRLRNRSINALLDWQYEGPNSSFANRRYNLKKYDIDYIKFNINHALYNPEYELFKDLLFKMLIVDPEKRITIGQVLSHKFFQNLKRPAYLSIKRPIKNINFSEHTRIGNFIDNYTDNTLIKSVAMIIYKKCDGLDELDEYIKAAACTWIASKLVIGQPPTNVELPPHQLLAAERAVCHNIRFRLHTL